MPSLVEQLRADRRRRRRRRRTALSAISVLPAALVGVRLVAATTTRPPTDPGSTATTAATTAVSVPRALQPGLVDAFERARVAAADAGHDLTITSGFRTAAEQAALLDAEVAERGSLGEALWWVFPPDRSMHVQGLAIDVGDGPAADWLDAAGSRFGLCRTLSWEWWHFEWRAQWQADDACPDPAATPADAPAAERGSGARHL